MVEGSYEEGCRWKKEDRDGEGKSKEEHGKEEAVRGKSEVKGKEEGGGKLREREEAYRGVK